MQHPLFQILIQIVSQDTLNAFFLSQGTISVLVHAPTFAELKPKTDLEKRVPIWYGTVMALVGVS